MWPMFNLHVCTYYLKQAWASLWPGCAPPKVNCGWRNFHLHYHGHRLQHGHLVGLHDSWTITFERRHGLLIFLVLLLLTTVAVLLGSKEIRVFRGWRKWRELVKLLCWKNCYVLVWYQSTCCILCPMLLIPVSLRVSHLCSLCHTHCLMCCQSISDPKLCYTDSSLWSINLQFKRNQL